jgi:hypothetical protein
MLTPQWLSDHTGHTKILLVEFPQGQELVDYGFLLSETTKFRDESRLEHHGTEVEVAAEAVKREEQDVEDGHRVESCWSQSVSGYEVE